MNYLAKYADETNYSFEAMRRYPVMIQSMNILIHAWAEKSRQPVELMELFKDHGIDSTALAEHTQHAINYWLPRTTLKEAGPVVAPKGLIGG